MIADPINTSTASDQTFPKIQVRFFGAIRVVINKVSAELDYIPDTTVSGLLHRLSDEYGNVFRDEVFDGKGPCGLRDDLMVTLNDMGVNHEKASETEVKPGDTVALYPTFPGGG